MHLPFRLPWRADRETVLTARHHNAYPRQRVSEIITCANAPTGSLHSPSGIGAVTDGAKEAGARVIALGTEEGSSIGSTAWTGFGASVSYMVGSAASGARVGLAVGVDAGSSAMVGSTLAAGAGSSVIDTDVGSTVGAATGSSVSGTLVGSGCVELGDGDMGVSFPSVVQTAHARSGGRGGCPDGE